MTTRVPLIERIPVVLVYTTGGRRPVDNAAVDRLAESIKEIGLQSPITVRYVKPYIDPEDGELDGAYVLVAGKHRLEAVRRLGQDYINAVVTDWDDQEARLWEISENLHRADLTVQQRSDQIAEWIRITEERQARVLNQLGSKPQGGRPEGGVRAAVRELGISQTAAQRAIAIAKLSDEARAAAAENGIADNQRALEQVAKAATPQQQVATILKLVDGPDDAELEQSERKSLLNAWNKARPEVRQWFRETIVDQPVMDRRFGR